MKEFKEGNIIKLNEDADFSEWDVFSLSEYLSKKYKVYNDSDRGIDNFALTEIKEDGSETHPFWHVSQGFLQNYFLLVKTRRKKMKDWKGEING